MKTNELIGSALDWVVAKCEGVPVDAPDYQWKHGKEMCQYSTNWAQGGPIIERERIELYTTLDAWCASLVGYWRDEYDKDKWLEVGPTPLIAAMRCYVASKLGDEVDISKELE